MWCGAIRVMRVEDKGEVALEATGHCVVVGKEERWGGREIWRGLGGRSGEVQCYENNGGDWEGGGGEGREVTGDWEEGRGRWEGKDPNEHDLNMGNHFVSEYRSEGRIG